MLELYSTLWAWRGSDLLLQDGCRCRQLRPAAASLGRTGRLRRVDSDSHDSGWQHCVLGN
jgi:hypothetical protein